MQLNDKEKELLAKWADYIVSDEASTDDFLFEGMTFQESLTLMEHISKIVKLYLENKNG